jgi:hypothetical protein
MLSAMDNATLIEMLRNAETQERSNLDR